MPTVLTSEESSSYPDESVLELGLGLSSCGGGRGGKSKLGFSSEPSEWGQYARILTAKDFPSTGGVSDSGRSRSPSSLSSSSSSSSCLIKSNFAAADPVSPPANNAMSNQVVGWPPIRAYRMNSMMNQLKDPCNEEFQSSVENGKSKNDYKVMDNSEEYRNYDIKEKGPQMKKLNFVKVNMDGNGIGRKVDLSAHSCYRTLAHAIEDMFCGGAAQMRRSSVNEHEDAGSSKLLDGSSQFVLTYEDRDGDWLLVGDVPWGMFINSVKRLRIMRTSEASRLGPRFHVGNGSRNRPI